MSIIIIIPVVAIIIVAIIIGVVGFIRIRRLDRAAPPPGHQHHVPYLYVENLGEALATRNFMLCAITLLLAMAIAIMLMQPLIAYVTPISPASPTATTTIATQEANTN
ncbi:hypothetical protein GZ998_05295 [Actinomyces sp. 594]|uniref:hypothetical protein n=1 Tax=Actinomyces sp. 594 TaxID=2057793 RepID=UPI001C57E2F3|nr:hypothetical protein [Actinomyces sp. 594]MBW3068927.1 hypothetical protein [Actinomyces sp. 594]